MLVDSRKLPQGEIINTEVCIVGAGPAGIALAKELIGKNFRVCLLESGDLEVNEETESLNQGEVVGDPFAPLHEMRRRQFGGLANVWNIEIHDKKVGVRHAPLDPIDFEKRDWVPYSGWPIRFSTLKPYYDRAQQTCKLGAFDYEPDKWENPWCKRIPFNNDRVTTNMFQFGLSGVFAGEYRQEIDQSANITSYLNANVVEIEADETGQNIQRVQAATLAGNKFWVSAKVFILAAGGIENARLLLVSDKIQKKGLGNQHDVVGRYFMDHPLVNLGLLTPQDRTVFNKMSLYDKRFTGQETVMGKFVLTDAAMRNEKLLNMSALIFPREDSYKSRAKLSAKALLHSLRHGRVPNNALQLLKNFVLDIDDVAVDFYKLKVKKKPIYPSFRFGDWTSQNGNEHRYSKFEVISQTEQTPTPDNRIILSAKLDKLGLPQAKLMFRWSDFDINNVKRSQQVFAQEFASAGLGNMVFEWELDRPVAILSSHHNMGTTRMSENVKEGVVDANCKVHGLSNLFVAGGSVFTTGGYANPTLTIVALAIRLADHIKGKLALMGSKPAVINQAISKS